ncbi:MAG: cytochrome C, partial [Chloroflexota bacterium]
DCAWCHKVTTWSDWTFDHAKTGFALRGGHAKPSCAACHPNNRFAGTPTTCYACHAANDKHNGSFGKDCAACHSTTSWAGARFDHSLSRFPLTGAHIGIACARCHVGGVFKGTPTDCASCHTKPASHGAAFGGACSTCHSTRAWKPASFDHSRTAFKLTGAHKGALCSKCHVGGVFKGTPTACAGCHTKPASHNGFTGSACGSCHSTSAWRPATWSAAHSFPMRHGGAGGVCSRCHPSTWGSYTCSRCHSNSSMSQRHSGISGFTLTTCVKCHPKGGGGD